MKVELDDVINPSAWVGLPPECPELAGSSATTPTYRSVRWKPRNGLSCDVELDHAGASHVTYSLQFTSSATGTLVAQHGTITVAAPADTVFTAASTGALR